MPDPSGLVRASVSLRAVAPELWEQFVHEMRVYAASVTADFVRADVALLPRAQGMAIQANELSNIFREAPTLSERMDQRNGRRPVNRAGEWTG